MTKTKTIFHLSWLTSLYFIFLALSSYFIKSEFVLIGVVREMITLPLMVAQLAICVWSLYWWIKGGFKVNDYIFWIFLISFCTSFTIVLSFFYDF